MSLLCCIPLYHPDRERLNAIVHQLLYYRFQVLLVDNSSNGIHIDYSFPRGVQTYCPGHNIGTAGAYQKASEVIRIRNEFRWLLLLDQDSQVGHNYLQFCLHISENYYCRKCIYAPYDSRVIPLKARDIETFDGSNGIYSLRSISDAKSSGLFIPSHALASATFCQSLYVDYVDWLFCWQLRIAGYTVREAHHIPLSSHALGTPYACLFGCFVRNFPSKSRRSLQSASALYMISHPQNFTLAPLSRIFSISIRPLINILLDLFESAGIIWPLI